MKFRPSHIIFAAILLLVLSCSKGLSDGEYLRVQRQKVAAALAGGINTDALKPLMDSIRAGRDILEVDFSIDAGGNVRFLGEIDFASIQQAAELLDGTLPADAYRALLEDADACIHMGMYYDGNTNKPAAEVKLAILKLRDGFGEYLAYQPAFRFREGVSIPVIDFFKSDEFEDYREPLTELFYALLR